MDDRKVERIVKDILKGEPFTLDLTADSVAALVKAAFDLGRRGEEEGE